MIGKTNDQWECSEKVNGRKCGRHPSEHTVTGRVRHIFDLTSERAVTHSFRI